ncbi:MAG: TRAP transporter small permease, partial [Candidatus Eiseniibacteriota bacterium]
PIAEPKAMATLSRLFDKLIDLLAFLACLLICLLTGIVALDVILRALNVGSMPWALEGSEYMLYGVTFFGAPWVLRAGGHVSVDVLLQQMPARVARFFELVADLGGIVVSLFLLYYGTDVTLQSYHEHVVIYRSLVFPEWWILWVMPVTALCLVGEFIRSLARSLGGRVPVQQHTEGL